MKKKVLSPNIAVPIQGAAFFFTLLLIFSCSGNEGSRPSDPTGISSADSLPPLTMTHLADLPPDLQPRQTTLDLSKPASTFSIARNEDGAYTHTIINNNLPAVDLQPLIRNILKIIAGPAKEEDLSGSNGISNFTNYTSEDGLSGEDIWCTYLDRFGHLWVSSLDDGVVKYDGTHFTKYTEENGLAGNNIVHISEDRNGNIWFGTWGDGMSRYDGHTFTNFGEENGLASNVIWDIVEDDTGDFWFGTRDGISRYDGRSFRTYSKEDGLAHNHVHTVLKDSSGQLWFGTMGGGVSRYDGTQFITYNSTHGLSGNRISCIAQDSKGQLWFGTEGNGLSCFDPAKNSFTNYTTIDGLPDNHVSAITVDHSGTMWIGTMGGGMSRFDPENDQDPFITFTEKEGLAGNMVRSITKDREGYLWIGCLGSGLSRYDGDIFSSSLKRERSFFLRTEKRSLKDKNGNLWFPVSGYLVRVNNTTVSVYRRPGEFSSVQLNVIFEDRSGHIWFGTTGGAIRFDGQVLTSYTTDQGLAGNNIWEIAQDRADNLWFGTWGKGVGCFDGQSFITFDKTHGLAADLILETINDESGNLWFGGRGGISVMSKDQVLRLAGHLEAKRNKRASSSEMSELVSGSGGGPAGIFKSYTKAEGLSGYNNRTILPLPLNKIAVGSDQGITIFDWSIDSKDSQDKLSNLVIFNTESGFPLKGITEMFLDSEGRVLVGPSNGRPVLFDYGTVTKKRMPPRVYINQVKINNNAIAWHNLQSADRHREKNDSLRIPPSLVEEVLVFGRRLKKEEQVAQAEQYKNIHFDHIRPFFPVPEGLVLPYRHNGLTIHFGANELARPGAMVYQYKLEGFDQEWGPVTKGTVATFANLREGYYTFSIKARYTGLSVGQAGAWTEPVEYTFRILPPWYRSWWAYGVYLLLFGSGVYAFILWRTAMQRKKIREQEKELIREREVSQKLIQVDKLKDQFLANTSHELRTPLQGIIGISESLHDQAEQITPGELRENLAMTISSGKRLNNLINDILDFSKLKNFDIQLLRRPVNLRVLADIVLRNNAPLVSGKPLELINAVPGDLPAVHGDENRLQQILYNLIGNAIKFTEEGHVRFAAREKEGMIEARVEDTGPGIPESQQQAIFEEFEQGDGSISRSYSGTGLGLSISKRLVELHGGRMWVESEAGRGATFFFTLPVSVEKATTLAPQEDRPVARKAVYSSDIAPMPVTPAFDNGDAIRLLIVDDEPINQQVLKNHLAEQNFTLTQALNGEEALTLLEDAPPFDLVLLDVMMPRMSGYEVCQQIREQYLPSELPVIMVTAKNQLQDIVQGLTLGANDYLAKPFHKEELLARIHTQLDLHRIFSVAGRFVPNEFLHSLNRARLTEVQLGDFAEKVVTVLFADIRDYTALSEKMTPEENFRFVNAFHRRMGPVIQQHGGFVNQYLGDAIMAIFPATPEDALRASIQIQEKLRQYNDQRLQDRREPIKVGIGLHTGALIMGIIGDRHRMDATTISDTVNTASRIESLTKHYGVSVLLSQDSLDQIEDPTAFQLRYLGRVQVKGKKEPIGIYDCFSGEAPDRAARKQASEADFQRGLDHYFRREFPEAATAFNAVLKANPDDATARLFLHKSSTYTVEGVAEDWTGVEVMRVK